MRGIPLVFRWFPNAVRRYHALLSVQGVITTIALLFADSVSADVVKVELGFVESPDAKWVASVYQTYHRDSPAPPGAPSDALALRIRDSSGKEFASTPIAEWNDPGEGSYHVELAWSPDSHAIAFCNGGKLSVFDMATRRTKRLSGGIRGMRWKGPTTLVCIALGWPVTHEMTGEMENPNHAENPAIDDLRPLSVIRVSTDTGEKRTIFAPPAYGNPSSLSPDGSQLAFATEQEIQVADLEGRHPPDVMDKKGDVHSFTWCRDGSVCLVYLARLISDHARWDYRFVGEVHLYDSNSRRFTNLTSKVRLVGDGTGSGSFNPESLRAVAANGKWFVVHGYTRGKGQSPTTQDYVFRHWVCRIDPWSAVCLEDHIGEQVMGVVSEWLHPIASPSGDALMFSTLRSHSDEFSDLWLCKVGIGDGGKLTLSAPKHVARVIHHSWFWPADGKSIVNLEQGVFVAHQTGL
jgi:hypothetical protein